MKVAFVNQPMDMLVPPHQNSIGIWTYNVAARLAGVHQPIVFGKRSAAQPSYDGQPGVEYQFVPPAIPNRAVARALSASRFTTLSGLPGYASRLTYLDYAIQVGTRARRAHAEIIHIHNFSQFVPTIRRLNPQATIVLHMACEWLNQLDRQAIRARLADVDLIAGVSEYITDKARRRFPEFSHRFDTIYNGVDSSTFVPDLSARSTASASGRLRILFVGRVSPEKGVHDLLEAFRLIASEGSDVQLDIVGPRGSLPKEFLVGVSDEQPIVDLGRFYEQDYFEHLEAQVPPELADRVRFHGALSQSDLIAFYQRADVLVNPSYSESFGMSLVEAMACETPVVATRVGGMSEIIEGAGVGLLVNRSDAAALAGAVQQLLNDDELRTRMGQAGRRRVLERFSWDEVANSLVRQYREFGRARPSGRVDRSLMMAPDGGSAAIPLIRDEFADDQRAGRVPGTTATSGSPRLVVDEERRISIDGDALRMEPLLREGWGRESLAYGPFPREPGLAFAVSLLNGSNGSHSGTIDGGLRRRVNDWVRGPREDGVGRRLLAFLRYTHKRESVRLWWWWLRRGPRFWRGQVIEDNQAVGWFGAVTPRSPFDDGHCLASRTLVGETGQLVAAVRNGSPVVLPNLLNVPAYYVVVLRAGGAAYYAASVPDVRGLPAFPSVRPLALDTGSPVGGDDGALLWPGVHQSVLGQVGFSADTRVFGAVVESVAEWSSWFGTAAAADHLVGGGDLLGSAPERGSNEWQPAPWETAGGFVRSDEGVRAVGGASAASLRLDEPVGLIAVTVQSDDPDDRVGLYVRVVDAENYLEVEIDGSGATLHIVVAGMRTTLARNEAVALRRGAAQALQLSDDGSMVIVLLDDLVVFSASTPGAGDLDGTPAAGDTVGIAGAGPNLRLRDFEAHARTIELPPALRLPSPRLPEGQVEEFVDEFGESADDLRTARTAGPRWERLIGTGVIETTGTGRARVRASVASPNPGRTAYLVPWSHPHLADLEVGITPPGSKRGEGESGRGGLIFWQDATHYIIVSNWLDDVYPGASISLFVRHGPFEELFRAVWSNVGARVSWGVTHRLRVAFDGNAIVARVDGETVLVRSLVDVEPGVAPLRITRVGIVANWEWGDDTGSTFDRFVARAPATPSA